MSKSIEFGCPKCDRMFSSLVEMDEHLKEHTKPKPPITPNTIAAASPHSQLKVDPIVLKYVYDGYCPDCITRVTTLEIDVQKKHMVIAVCTRCSKQLDTRVVAKL